ncbi:MAG: AAA family ATPase [Marinilabiliaceae bacterium]|nr:AAA family ATPase [Marinilabiliaceae bacterium]
MITKVFKQGVIDKLKELETQSGLSAKRFAVKIGINQSQWSRLKKGDTESVLADSKFITIARENGINLSDSIEWKTAKTPTFQYIYSKLEICQQQSVSVLLVDDAGVGKTHTARYYSRNNRNAVYMDCSQVKSKQLFVREIARQFGVKHTGKYAEVYIDLVFYLNSIEKPLIILDEAGDLKYEAFLELKALWNATEYHVGWLMMGADGLKSKLSRAINCQKVGYTEIFRRYGEDYCRVSPQGKEALEQFKRQQAAMVAQANAPEGMDVQKLLKNSKHSLTNVYNIIRVMNMKKERA